MKKKLSISLVQHSAGNDVDANLARVFALLQETSSADLVALPEVFALRGSEAEHRDAAEPIDGPTVSALSAYARERHVWVLAGSILERAGDRIFNTSVLLDRDGHVAASYRKIHLFVVHMEDGTVIREDELYDPGDTPVMADIEGWSCGLSVCYDLRFPELYRDYSSRGAHVLFAPSNFTQRTGKDHWHVLVRARAIENQCFVIAPNQCGSNPVTQVESHGHSMVVGPWGEVLAEGGHDECVLDVELDAKLIEQTRARVPALEHRRL